MDEKTPINTYLRARASAELEKEIAEELKKKDPPKDEAKAALYESTQ